MDQRTRWIPWVVGGLIILVLIYFAVQGGIGAATDETSKAAGNTTSFSNPAPNSGGAPSNAAAQ